VLAYAAMIGIGCYLIAVAKPLANRDFHPGVFGIAMACIAIYECVR
jgi:hypothetical protein